jgi:hypothetical protein
MGSRMRERIGNFMIRIVDFIDIVFIMTASLLQVGFSDLNSSGILTEDITKFGVVAEVASSGDGRRLCH